MKKDKCNSRESWFLLFMPENHNLHPNFIEIPFINVSKDFLDNNDTDSLRLQTMVITSSFLH